jgi:hypothetical protein
MAFNIESFKSNGLIYGGARPSLFKVIMGFPQGAAGIQADPQRASFLIRAAQLPASTVDPIDIPYFGRKIKIAGDRTFADWTITVMNDEDFQLRNSFEAWLNYINTHVSNRSGEGNIIPSDYKVAIEVQQYGKAGPSDEAGIIRSYLLSGAFPTSVDAISLDWDTTNTVETFDVTFAYDYWEPALTGFSGASYPTSLPGDI